MKNRLWYVDLIRIVSIFLVIVVHISSSNFDWYQPDSAEWQIINAYDSVARICVPLFVMISGIFFLDPKKEIGIRKLYRKNIWRIVRVFLFWSSFYAVFMAFYPFNSFSINQMDETMNRFIEGHFHLWFLFRIVELYIMTPVLRKISEEKKLMQYIMLYCFILGFIIPTIRQFPIGSTVTMADDWINLDITFGYVGYFFAGSYLHRYGVTPVVKKWIYALGVIGLLTTFLGTGFLSIEAGKPVGWLYEYLTPNVMITSLAVFLWFKETFNHRTFSKRTQKWIKECSDISFGVYLSHVLIIFLLNQSNITTQILNPILSVPLLTGIVAVLGYMVVKLMSKVPGLKKWIL